MEQLNDYADSRLTGFCVYCGGSTETRDHTPSKVFLDAPYPTNLTSVFACRQCNLSFSLDEEYFACLIECVLAGSVALKAIGRSKIRRILMKKPALAARLAKAVYRNDGVTYFSPEESRVRNIILKLARGHVAYELSQPKLSDPYHLAFLPMGLMDDQLKYDFETLHGNELWPEVGSRAMQRLLISGQSAFSPWLIVQEGNYRYSAFEDGDLVVRGVLREYLAYEVRWTGE